MSRNFWTEENKIMNFDCLIRADMKKKLMNMENQIVYGRDIADLCYNYDYLIGQREKAIQFIADYADDFVKSLYRYQRTLKRPFSDISNSLKAVNLMALYRAKDITRSCPMIRKNWDNKITLKLDVLNDLMQELSGPELPEERRLSEKVFITKEILQQVCHEHICDCLQSLVGKNATIADLEKSLKMPVVSEQTAKSVLKNSYAEVARLAASASPNTRDIYLFIESVVLAKSKELANEGFFAQNRNIAITQEFVDALRENLNVGFRNEVYLKPEVGTKTQLKQEISRDKEPQRRPIREK